MKNEAQSVIKSEFYLIFMHIVKNFAIILNVNFFLLKLYLFY